MRMKAGKSIVWMLGLLLAAGIPYAGATSAQADPGCGCHAGKGHGGGCGCCDGGCGHHEGCGCGHACPKGAGPAGAECPCGMPGKQASGGMHPMMHGKDAPPMKERMGKHLETMKSTIRKLRDLEAKMDSLKAKDDAAAFRAASLEHAKLLTDLQESHLKHMQEMAGGGK